MFTGCSALVRNTKNWSITCLIPCHGIEWSSLLPEKKIIAISNICRYSIIGYFLHFLWSGMTHDVKEATKEIGDLLEEFIAHEIEITQ